MRQSKQSFLFYLHFSTVQCSLLPSIWGCLLHFRTYEAPNNVFITSQYVKTKKCQWVYLPLTETLHLELP